ncbi:MAG: 4Fe-4S binding protein [Ignavibacteria bacterium]
MTPVQITIPAAAVNTAPMLSSLHNRGLMAYGLGIALTSLYSIVYWRPETFGAPQTVWFWYSVVYTLVVCMFGAKKIIDYRNDRYQMLRTVSLVTVQLLLAFILPNMLRHSGHGEFYFSYFWPLKPEYLFPSTLHSLIDSPDRLRVFMGWWSVIMLVVATPVLTYFYGKRWYCSWVCGCGALAETAGDSFRHLSSKSPQSWTIERWTIYPVLMFITIITALLWYVDANPDPTLQAYAETANRIYGFVIGGLFSGVVGVGFYPILGSRVWCRFGCPMAAVLGILQKYASRFRIETNQGQCISCGNCSTYCEMGIDVRSYAQEGKDIKRASCVGCGVCVSVCPRGVLRAS